MARITTTLLEIIRSELRKNHNEHFNDNQLTFFNDEYAFIKKAMRYDSDVEEIVNKVFFQNLTLEKIEYDRHFKKMFLNEFLNKQIKTQTVESFSSYVISVFLQNENYLNSVYSNYENFLIGKSLSENKTIFNNRQATQELPQNQVNVDLNDDTFEYASTNNISKNLNTSDGSNTSFSPDTVNKSRLLLKTVIQEFDRKCFLQVY